MKKVKLEERFINELKKLNIHQINVENSYDVHERLFSRDGYLGNLENRTQEIEQELDTVWDFLNFWDDTEEAGNELDYDWINEQLSI